METRASPSSSGARPTYRYPARRAVRDTLIVECLPGTRDQRKHARIERGGRSERDRIRTCSPGCVRRKHPATLTLIAC